MSLMHSGSLPKLCVPSFGAMPLQPGTAFRPSKPTLRSLDSRFQELILNIIDVGRNRKCVVRDDSAILLNNVRLRRRVGVVKEGDLVRRMHFVFAERYVLLQARTGGKRPTASIDMRLGGEIERQLAYQHVEYNDSLVPVNVLRCECCEANCHELHKLVAAIRRPEDLTQFDIIKVCNKCFNTVPSSIIEARTTGLWLEENIGMTKFEPSDHPFYDLDSIN